MKKRTKLILAALAALMVILIFTLGLMLGRQSGPAPASESRSVSISQQSQTPPQSIPPANTAPPGPASGSIPYVGPIESPIIGKWEDKDMGTHNYNSYFEFSPDGTLTVTTYQRLDADYSENWNTKIYDFYFDTWRGQEVIESGYFMGYAHHKLEFYELDGRQAVDVITIKDDNSEYVTFTLLKIEE